MIDWHNISYLQQGSTKQKTCYSAVTHLQVLESLVFFEPIVVGTIPLGIDIESSDIDIVCCAEDLHELESVATSNYSNLAQYKVTLKEDVLVENFFYKGFEFEIYGSHIPSTQQHAYRHMVLEYRLLSLAPSTFKKRIIELKLQGYKTEPAFGKLLGLGEPYQDLLDMEKLTDQDLINILNDKNITTR